MNTPKSVGWGWVAFTAAGVLGSYVGYKQWKDGTEARKEQAVALRARQQKKLDEINARRREMRSRQQTSAIDIGDAGLGGNAASDAPNMP